MEKEKLREEDYIIIKRLLAITKDIKSYYDKLSFLESNNNKNSIEYINISTELNILLDEESAIYELLAHDQIRLQKVIEYFCSKDKLNVFFEELRVIVEGNDNDLIKWRIITTLLTYKLKIEQEKLHEMGMSVKKQLEELNTIVSNYNFGYFGLANLLELNSHLKEDFLNSLFVLSKDSTVKKENLKFIISFLYRNFNADSLKEVNELYLISKLISENKKIPLKTYEEMKKNFGYNLAVEILEYIQNDATNKELWDLILRVSLLFCSSEEKEKLREEYYLYIKNLLNINNSDQRLLLVLSLKG